MTFQPRRWPISGRPSMPKMTERALRKRDKTRDLGAELLDPFAR